MFVVKITFSGIIRPNSFAKVVRNIVNFSENV